MCRRQAHACTHVFTQTRMHALSPARVAKTPPKQGKSGSQVAAVTQEVPRYLRSCPLSSDATSSMWTWSHSCKMEKRADVWRDLFQGSAPVQAGLAYWEEPVGRKAPKSKPINQYRLLQWSHTRYRSVLKTRWKVSVSDITSYCCETAGI